MRYAVISTSLTITQLQDEVKRCGGRNLRVATASRQIFCDLDDTSATRLRVTGNIVTKVGKVKTEVMPPIVAPPTPIAGIPTYTPQELVIALGFEELRPVMEPPLYGEGFNLAVIGTGIRETHEKINGRVVYRKNYTTDLMEDGFDHDTGVCSIALAVAPLCNILNLKVLDAEGEGSEEDVAIAVDDCIAMLDTNPDMAPDVINLSLGAPDEGNPNDPLRVACRAAIERGIWISASAGNSGPASYSITSPACEKYVLAVGSCKYEPFEVSNWSSRGPTLENLSKPDVLMFGEDLEVASSLSDSASIAKSGTSFAAPFLSGFGILYREGLYRQAVATQPIPGISIEVTWSATVKDIINIYLPLICIKPEGAPPGKDADYGYGLVFGPLVYQAIVARPLLDISTIMQSVAPIIGLVLMGMIIIPMTKGLK